MFMAWKNKHIVWAILMVAAGSTNSLSTKWADTLVAKNRAGKDAHFNHPFLQACAMFLAEIICFVIFKIRMCCEKSNKEFKTTQILNRRWNPIVFLPPALCDIAVQSLSFIGLTLTYISSLQMLQGAVIVFTGLLSMAFLGRKFKSYEWLGIFTVTVGLVCTGIADVINPTQTGIFSTNSIITGDLLIIMAQFIMAVQMVIEEKFLTKYNVPVLQGVGWEGIFGFSILSFLLIPMYFIKVGNSIFDNPLGRMEDAYDGFVQMYNNPLIIAAISGQMASVVCLSYSGLSLTKEISASNRIVLNNSTTLSVWILSVSFGWQKYHYLQLVVFFILISGMCIYNDVLFRPLYLQLRNKCCQKSEVQPLLGYSGEELASTLVETKSTCSDERLSP